MTKLVWLQLHTVLRILLWPLRIESESDNVVIAIKGIIFSTKFTWQNVKCNGAFIRQLGEYNWKYI
jgi:hypothetical protein